jgi:hypothetical protein
MLMNDLIDFCGSGLAAAAAKRTSATLGGSLAPDRIARSRAGHPLASFPICLNPSR